MSRARFAWLAAAALVLALLLGLRGGRDSPLPPSDAAPPAPAAVAATADAPAAPDVLAAQAAHEETYRAALTRLRHYIGALPGGERARADAMWAGGAPPATTREADLRQLDAAPTWMRLASRSSEMRRLDDGGVRLPVELRLGYDSGVRVYRGWYALRRGDDATWWITDAEIDAPSDRQ